MAQDSNTLDEQRHDVGATPFEAQRFSASHPLRYSFVVITPRNANACMLRRHADFHPRGLCLVVGDTIKCAIFPRRLKSELR